MFSNKEFFIALEKAKKDHPTISADLAESVMKKFVERWESNQKKPVFMREVFGQLIRFTLNELHIGKPKRQMYSALIGHYYTARAAYVKALRLGPRPKTANSANKSIEVTQSSNGQLAWQI